MWRCIRQENPDLRVNQKTVRQIMKVLDPIGVERRKHHRLTRRKYISPGPNYLWHSDGYDKLKPFGFAIHGAVDGYSRRILWLHVSPMNNEPAVIAGYYLNYLKEYQYAPRILRCDLGTENTTIEVLQPYFRYKCNDEFAGVKTFMYGNQRIKAWWGLVRKSYTDWWIHFFKDLRARGMYNGHDAIHVRCLRYCFMGVLRFELQRPVSEWNSLSIRSNKNGECPSGRPDVITFLRNCMIHIILGHQLTSKTLIFVKTNIRFHLLPTALMIFYFYYISLGHLWIETTVGFQTECIILNVVCSFGAGPISY